MWLILLVFVSDALITFFQAKTQLAVMKLSWQAVFWDMLLTLVIGVNILGFVTAGWWMLIPSLIGSALGMTGAIWHGRRKSGLSRRARIHVGGFRPGTGSNSIT